jgi:hypothetical protein
MDKAVATPGRTGGGCHPSADSRRQDRICRHPHVCAREQIYPREIQGRFASLRWLCVFLTQLVFYGLPWINWNERQAVLFDLASRKFYLFGLVLWPQDFIWLAALLIICAFSLFLFTAMAGRVWCGYACPQTVYTEIFLWIERRIEGNRSARMRLDRQPWSFDKLWRKSAKHLAWGALALWTGFTFVGYFTPIRELLPEMATGAGPVGDVLGLFYGFATYGNAGWMREQVCKYMCPYARFQSAMFDRDTLIITYDAARGEPRMPAAKAAKLQEGRKAATASIARCACRSARPASISAGPAVHVHRLRRLRRRLRQRDGQDRPPARPDPLFHRERHRAGLLDAGDPPSPVASAHPDLHRHPGRGDCLFAGSLWCARR